MTRLSLYVSLDAIEHNARVIREALAPDVKLCAVVKADAYGHDAHAVSGRLLASGLADALAVATAEEGARLRASLSCVGTPILVLGALSDMEDARLSVAHKLSPAVFDAAGLALLTRACKELNARTGAQLALDTGMARIGTRGEQELDALLSTWSKQDFVRMDGAFTHFCWADGDLEYTRLQDERFRSAIARVRAHGFSPVCHAAASTALANHAYGYDMARAGIALYGVGTGALQSSLRYAQTLVTHPVRVAWIDEGETVGYSRAFTASRRTKVMTLPCGYGDGYPRILSGRAHVLVNGHSAPIIGNVCMDMMMADATDTGEVDTDSRVTLLGAQGDARITPDELARFAQTIPYEIMLGFSPRVTRRIGSGE